MKDKILVIGGYGQVGQTICKDLGKIFPEKVIAAGRNFDKAKRFGLQTEGNVIPLQFDISNSTNWDNVLNDITLVIMCLDQNNTKFVETCISKSIHYIDISASYSFLSQVESSESLAKKSGSTVLLGVGLCPGLTNMLVKHSLSNFDSIEVADIFIMLGLGDKHGKAAIEWTVDTINSDFSVIENNSIKQVKGFGDGKKTIFPGKYGKRTAYRFDFVDQQVIPKTLGVKIVSTRLCFDSALLTKTFAFLKRLGFFNLLELNFFRNLMVFIFEHFHFGSDLFILKVDSMGVKKNQQVNYQCSIKGNNESYGTAKVASLVAESLLTEKFPSGVYYLEELFEPKRMFAKLSDYFNFSFESGND